MKRLATTRNQCLPSPVRITQTQWAKQVFGWKKLAEAAKIPIEEALRSICDVIQRNYNADRHLV